MSKELDHILWELWLSRMDLPAVIIADEIGLFSAVNNGCKNVGKLSETLKLSKQGIDALCVFLASIGLLNKDCQTIELSQSSYDYLQPQSRFYWGPAIHVYKERIEYSNLLCRLRDKDKLSSPDGTHASNTWKTGELSTKIAKRVANVMHANIVASAHSAVSHNVFKNTESLLDVGGGSGSFVSLLRDKYPLRDYGIFDLPAAIKIAQEELEGDKIAQRVNLHAGNFFTDKLPTGYDGILFSNILHDWPKETALFLAKKSYDALPSGGMVYIHEMILNESKNGPKIPAAFNWLMYVNHGSQQYTLSELKYILKETGFSDVCVEKHHPFFSTVIAVKQY